MRNGIAFDLASALEPAERAAFCIRFGMFEGGKFDWETGDWAEPGADDHPRELPDELESY